MHPSIERILPRLADALVDRWPQAVPSEERLARCRIISHRGQHDNLNRMENSIAAFESAAAAGVWGIEMDIRWTRDLWPVVFHDPDLLRVYGARRRIDEFTLPGLRRRYPAIPSLARVVAQFGNRLHLMIEIKQEPWRDQGRQVRRLEKILRPLEPGADFHLLSIHPEMLLPFSGLPPSTMVAVSTAWPGSFSRWVLDHGWGGLCGHYLPLHTAMIRRHHARHQAVGTGFPGTRNSLFRELHRGVDWIFSNDAAGLQAVVESVSGSR